MRVGDTLVLTRRSAILGAGAGALATLGIESAWTAMVEDISELRPGDFTWHPDRSPAGPVAVVVSLPDQLVHVYRNGIRIAVSTCSTGKPGHSTPTGVFTVLQKDKHHHSSTYDNAPMPNMNRLTWSGIALHAGNLPGYPASHGCVRLPMEFSEKLWTVTEIGTPVIICGKHADPVEIVHPGLVLAGAAAAELDAAVAAEKTKPSGFSGPVTSVLVSGADSSVSVLQNGDVVVSGAATIADPKTPLGSHVFVLSQVDGEAGRLVWLAVSHDAEGDAPHDDPLATIRRIRAPQHVVDAISERMVAGTVFVTTDLPAHPDTRSGKDFVVVTTDDA